MSSGSFGVTVQSYLEHVQVGLVEALLGSGGRPGTGRLVVRQDDDVGGGSSPVVVGLTVEQNQRTSLIAATSVGIHTLLDYLMCFENVDTQSKLFLTD